ncbi:MAG: aminoglycoside phosphotransferase family protein [Oligoflexus sp.]
MPITSRKRTDALPPPPPDVICKALGIQHLTIEWLAGDGSDRCYYRILSSELAQPLVLMQLSLSDAKKLENNGYEWIQIGDLLSESRIFVPQTVCTLPEYAALLIEDYGDLMMESQVKDYLGENATVEAFKLYERAIYIVRQMLNIQADPQAVWCQRRFDQERFVWEMNFFAKHYLQQARNIFFNEREEAVFQKEVVELSKHLVSGPEVFVHRDFHSRNIMLRDERLALLDFQDARLGPASYDLVSLVFDSYVPLTNESRLKILENGLEIIRTDFPQHYEDIQTRWQAMLLQRQLKAIGSFGYLSIEKRRGKYLDYVPKALETLDHTWVYDKRWPFLSEELLARMRSN